ncbi:MAG TPA: DEAD/DEAH box helicase [Candidatus Limnocylindria bacterium]|nr:DEAD/DEAH box helicase [Candidatus Limnocylindria bacterium]
MESSIILENPDLVRDEMRAMDSAARARGEQYFAEGRVQNLRREKRAGEFLAEVQGSELYAVRVHIDEEGAVETSCSCPLKLDCKHIYATLKGLLVEHTRGHVHALSAMQKANPVARSRPGTFDEQVAAALGRALTAKEQTFLKNLARIYEQCRVRRTITYWDFQEMGLPLGGPGWEGLKIWPTFPETLRQFWLYVAHAAAQRGAMIPEFLQAVSDVAHIDEELRRWQRAKEIERWKSALGQAHPSHLEVINTSAPVQRVDMRVVFHERAAVLEWLPAGKENFAPMKMMQTRELQRQLRESEAELTTEAEWIWQAFEPKWSLSNQTEMEYFQLDAQRSLARLFRMPPLQSRLVSARGEPLQFIAEPLQWHLDPAKDEDDDYRIRLTQADGAPVPPTLCVLPGRPRLYVTAEKVFPGPPLDDHVLDPNSENRIPAPALESRGGAAMLRTFGLEMPPRLRDRVHVVPLSIHLTCELRASYAGSSAEVCVIEAQAATPDGRTREKWNGYTWERAGRAAKEEKKNGIITLHDRQGISEPLAILAPLEAKWDTFQRAFSIRLTKKFADNFAAWIKSVPPHVHVELKGELASFTQDAIAGRVKLDVSEAEIDWFDLRVVLDVTDTTLTQEELKLLLNARGGYVRLKDKGWRRLEFNLTEEEDEQLARLGLSPRELSAEPQRLHALQLADTAAKKFLPQPQFERIVRRVDEIKARVTPDIPATVKAELRPYQRDGFHFLAYLSANNFGGILADDMGLGKTLQALAWLEWLRTPTPNSKPETQLNPSLVVCPKSVTDNWRAESERFAPGLRVKVWHAGDVKNLPAQLADADLHVLNYNQLRSLGEGLADVRWLAVILDEGQYIKNPSSITAMIARSLRAQHRLVLSGTPIENRLMDLWSLMSFAMPGALGSRAQFTKIYDSKEDPFARRRLSARVRPFLLRRTKSQVAKDLPDRTEEDLFCEIEGEQKTLYRAELKRAQQLLLRVTTQKQLAQERFNVLTSLLRLRQICCHPRLVKPDSLAASAKVESLMDQLEPLMEEGHKVLIFSQFVEMLDILREAIAERGWPLFYLAGHTENRGDLVRNFQAAEGAAAFLISLKAGGFGLNLTAASYVVLFDPWWNPAVENQAIDRTHRIGQTRNVIAYRLLIKDSIEEKIRALQKTKSALADDVLGEEKFSQSLTIDELRFLFSDDAPAK